jgi:hypothetical protein
LDNHAIGVKEVEDEIRLMSFTEYDLEQKTLQPTIRMVPAGGVEPPTYGL